jgi:type IV pilus assembly protein PilE
MRNAIPSKERQTTVEKCRRSDVKTGTQQGFTLIELMITVAIIGVLAAVAYPSYIQHTVRANRSAAQSYMLGLANKQEQMMLDTRQYSTSASTLLATPVEVSRNYGFVIDIGASTYTITATPTGTQLVRDAKCNKLTLTQTGAKGIAGGTSSNPSDCW